MSTVILAHPFTHGNPAETDVFAQPDTGQRALVADLGAIAGLLKNPGF
jgi:hypothetical protein